MSPLEDVMDEFPLLAEVIPRIKAVGKSLFGMHILDSIDPLEEFVDIDHRSWFLKVSSRMDTMVS